MWYKLRRGSGELETVAAWEYRVWAEDELRRRVSVRKRDRYWPFFVETSIKPARHGRAYV